MHVPKKPLRRRVRNWIRGRLWTSVDALTIGVYAILIVLLLK